MQLTENPTENPTENDSPQVSRRGFLVATAGLSFAIAMGPKGLSLMSRAEAVAAERAISAWVRIALPREWVVSGPPVPELTAFDTTMQQYMEARGITAGALAVTWHSRLVLARGYTWAPVGTPTTRPTSLFRIASVSKPLTAVGVLRLVQEGSLELDQTLGTILDTTGWIDSRVASGATLEAASGAAQSR